MNFLKKLLNIRKEKEEKRICQEETSLGMNPMKEEDTLLRDMIKIPVKKRTELIQCGTFNWVYPPNNYEHK